MSETPQLYGVESSQEGSSTAPRRNTTFREKLTEKFAATDFVRVINIDDEAYSWQYLPQSREEHIFNTGQSSVPQKETVRGLPELMTIQPGQSMVILGESAYLMIEGLYKKLLAKKTIADHPNMQPGQARSFNFSDETLQGYWINQIFLGKERPQFKDTNKGVAVPARNELDKDLGLTDEKSAVTAQARPAKA